MTSTESKLIRRQILTALKREKARQKREQYRKEPGQSPINYGNFWANVSKIALTANVSNELTSAIFSGVKKVSP